MRFVPAAAVVVLTLSLNCPCAPGFASDAQSPDALAALEAKANQAPPRDQCFLYAKLVDQMTALAGREMDSGDTGKASATLKQIQQYAGKIQTGMALNSKKLKNAELLMQRTSFRLKDILNSASLEDREVLQATLKQLNQVQSQLMMEVFKK